MDARPAPPALRVLAWAFGLAPSGIMMSAGVFLIAVAALVPPWLDLGRARAQLSLMREQAVALTERSDRYQSFLMELDRGDPALLERLAHTQLRLQPTGRRPLELDAGALDAPADVAAWLDVPLPDAGRLAPTNAGEPGRLHRLVSGPTRYGVLTVGAIFAVCGVCWGRGREEPEPAPAIGQIAPPAGPYPLPAAARGRRAG